MKKIILLMTAILMLMAGCGGTDKKSAEKTVEPETANAATVEKVTDLKGKKILIAYFSRADENYQVGNIEVGNTKILAEMLKDMTGADIFEIKNTKEYPKEYKETTDIAKEEKESKARPEINKPLPNVQDYDIILLGYPIWWSDLPMAVYTFFDNEKFDGKVIAPFCTHEGSGIGSTLDFIANYTNAKVLSGLDMRGTTAQNDRDKAKKLLEDWLKKIEKEI